MDKFQKQKLASVRSTEEVLDKSDAWKGIPILVTLRPALRQRVELVETIAADQEDKNTGIAADKQRIANLLMDTMVIVSGQLVAWAELNQNATLSHQAYLTRSSLRGLGPKLTERAMSLHELGTEHKDALAEFGLSDELLTALENRATAYHAIAVAPRTARAETKTLTRLLDTELTGIMRLLKKVWDPLMRQLKETEGQFYQDYRNARRIGKPVGPRSSSARITSVETPSTTEDEARSIQPEAVPEPVSEEVGLVH